MSASNVGGRKFRGPSTWMVRTVQRGVNKAHQPKKPRNVKRK